MDTNVIDAFDTDGYVIVRGLVPRDVCARLLDIAQDLRRSDNPRAAAIAVQNHHGKGGRVSMVKLNQLTTHDPEFAALAHREEIVDVVETLIGPGARLFRDVVVIKPGGTGGILRHHQDSAYWDVEPKRLVSAWVALSDAPVEAGPLSVVPGSHRTLVTHSLAVSDRVPVPAPVTALLRRLVSMAGTGDNVASASGRGLLWRVKRLVVSSGSRLAPVLARLSDYHVRGVDPDDCEVLGAQAGDVVFFHSLLVHGTGPNVLDADRVVDIVSYMPSDATLPRADASTFPLARQAVA